MGTFAEAGFHGVAPFMRGYAPTAPAPDGRYESILLAQDDVNFTSVLGANQSCIVGHDWGALERYVAAAQAPNTLPKIATIAVVLTGALIAPLQQTTTRSKVLARAFFQMAFSDKAAAAHDYEFT